MIKHSLLYLKLLNQIAYLQLPFYNAGNGEVRLLKLLQLPSKKLLDSPCD